MGSYDLVAELARSTQTMSPVLGCLPLDLTKEISRAVARHKCACAGWNNIKFYVID